jgi:hypothetical protein
MSFDPKKYLINLKGKEYLPVSARLIWFRQEHPDWSIVTTPVEINMEKNFAIFSATIMNAEGKIIATGTKMETIKDFGDFLEKAETGSVGRALAMCGFGTQFAPEFAEGNRLADAPMGPSARFAPRQNNMPNGGGNFNNRPGPMRPNAPMNGSGNGNNEPRPPMPMTAMEDERPFDRAATAPPAPRERPVERPAPPAPSPRPQNEVPQRATVSAPEDAPPAPKKVVRERVPEPDYTDPGGDDEPEGPDDLFTDDFPALVDAAPRPAAPVNLPPVQLGSDKPNPLANNPVCSSPGCTMKLTPGQMTLSMQKYGKPLCVLHQREAATGADRTANAL